MYAHHTREKTPHTQTRTPSPKRPLITTTNVPATATSIDLTHTPAQSSNHSQPQTPAAQMGQVLQKLSKLDHKIERLKRKKHPVLNTLQYERNKRRKFKRTNSTSYAAGGEELSTTTSSTTSTAENEVVQTTATQTEAIAHSEYPPPDVVPAYEAQNLEDPSLLNNAFEEMKKMADEIIKNPSNKPVISDAVWKAFEGAFMSNATPQTENLTTCFYWHKSLYGDKGYLAKKKDVCMPKDRFTSSAGKNAPRCHFYYCKNTGNKPAPVADVNGFLITIQDKIWEQRMLNN